ncbi:MAG: hypothetical protein R6W71_03270 [Bacteroidales bacterium]
MSRLEKLLILLIIIVMVSLGAGLLGQSSSGPIYIDTPVQVGLEETREIIHEGKNGTVNMVLLAEYSITAVVKSRRNYSTDTASAVSPMDLVLAWGNLNAKNIDDAVTYTQRNRWYFYRLKSTENVTLYDIQTQSANTHVIPADEVILKELNKIRRNDLVELQGYLVRVIFNPQAPPWTSSMTRIDTGDGSCEIMYVTAVTRK